MVVQLLLLQQGWFGSQVHLLRHTLRSWPHSWCAVVAVRFAEDEEDFVPELPGKEQGLGRRGEWLGLVAELFSVTTPRLSLGHGSPQAALQGWACMLRRLQWSALRAKR